MFYITVRRAHREWSGLDQRLHKQWEDLSKNYLSLETEALACGIAASEGLLGTARFILDGPRFDRQTLIQRTRLQVSLEVQMRGFFGFIRKANKDLLDQLREYRRLMEERIEMMAILAHRLDLARKVLMKFQQSEDFRAAHPMELAVISPEVADTLFSFLQERLETQKVVTHYLQRSLDTRIANGEAWIDLLGEKLSLEAQADYRGKLTVLRSKAGDELVDILTRHTRLTPLIDYLDREALRASLNLIEATKLPPLPQEA